MCFGVPYFAWMTTLLSKWIDTSLRKLTGDRKYSRVSSFQDSFFKDCTSFKLDIYRSALSKLIKLLYMIGGFVFLVCIPTYVFMNIEGEKKFFSY